MAHVSHKLKTPLQGALAGGGDPATSPLYVFGPFLSLIVGAGVADVTFGASIWMVIITVIMVSAMYRLVLIWVVDGSGGSGLNEEEFGGWAVKVNAGITFIEYTLTFLVSMAALVTFLSDRFPVLESSFAGVSWRALVGVALSIFTGALVNRGPKVAARAFGPATAAVLLLLWGMIAASLLQRGVQLPAFRLTAFDGAHLHYTLAGYTRLLALMTGIEVFANLVASYEGKAAEKSRMAFVSLLMIMGTTSLAMVIVGPSIFALSDPLHSNTSVFTQTMDRLLPAPLPYAGSLIGVAVLLSACAASAQGLQNLALGLRYRHYVPASFGQRNRYDVADRPVWLQVVVVSVCFLCLGTREETYLALYAAGVFVLLSLTGWAASKRLLRLSKSRWSLRPALTLVGTVVAASLTTGAAGLVFVERFREGVWLYCLLIPALYLIFSHYRSRLGPPTALEDRLGLVFSEQRYLSLPADSPEFLHLLVPLDGSLGAEQSLPVAKLLARAYASRISLVAHGAPASHLEAGYLQRLATMLSKDGLQVEPDLAASSPGSGRLSVSASVDLIIWASDPSPKLARADFLGMVQTSTSGSRVPILCLKDGQDWRERFTHFTTILVALDGSKLAEQSIAYACSLARRFDSRLVLCSIPEGAESETFAESLNQYTQTLVDRLVSEGIQASAHSGGSGPTRTLLHLAEELAAELIVLTSHGRGGVAGARATSVGSVAETLLKAAPCPVLLVPAVEGP